MERLTILEAVPADAESLKEIFFAHLASNPEYISHGEVQMGVGEMSLNPDGSVSAGIAPDGEKMWLKYISGKISSENAAVFKAVCGKDIAGFCVADIEEDGADPFGMVCDVLVKEDFRSRGIGDALLEAATGWLRSKGVDGIYLESGKDNHSAHRFFEKRGFVHVSEIYRLFP